MNTTTTTTTTTTTPMQSPGNAWKPGKTPGTWFRHVPIFGPVVAENGQITAKRSGVTVPAGPGWAVAMLAALPGQLVAFTFQNANQAQTMRGVARMPHGARGIPNCRGAENYRYTATPAPAGAVVTHRATGTWKQDDTHGLEAVILTAL